MFGSDPETWEDEERAIAVSSEMVSDVSLAMATGTISTWVSLARLYDEDKSLSNQSLEFQRQAAVTAASSIGMGFVLSGAGMTSAEFAVGRSVALKPITRVAYHPLVAVPAAIAYVGTRYPEVAGPQYQTAMSGQPSIGGSILNKRSSKSWKELFSAEYWGIV